MMLLGESPLTTGLTAAVGSLIVRPPVFVEPTASVAEAAQTMRRAWISSVLVSSDPPGIVTDRDLRNRVLAEGLGPETPVRQVMSAPLKSLPADAPIYGALLFMLEENVHHLPLTEGSQVVGVITGTDMLRHQGRGPLYLLERINNLAGAEGLAHYGVEITRTVSTLFEGGLDVTQIGRIITSLNDTLVKRLLRQAEAALGPPPTPYAWIVFGSEGRQEQTLLTDQDNALVYEVESEAAQVYFRQLAERVAAALVQAGFPVCKGGYMATRWCYPLAEWERRFKVWVEKPEPQALLDAAILFDFRQVYGTLDLRVLADILHSAGERPVFLAHLARATLSLQPPLGFFGKIQTKEDGVELKKGGIMPLVGLARLYGLEAGATTRSTLGRLDAAAHAQLLDKESVERLSEAFRLVLQFQLREQLRAHRANQPPTHRVPLKNLSAYERKHLKEAFRIISAVQKITAERFRIDRLA